MEQYAFPLRRWCRCHRSTESTLGQEINGEKMHTYLI